MSTNAVVSQPSMMTSVNLRNMQDLHLRSEKLRTIGSEKFWVMLSIIFLTKIIHLISLLLWRKHNLSKSIFKGERDMERSGSQLQKLIIEEKLVLPKYNVY